MNFQKFQLKWKIVKHFTRPKQWAALRKLFSLPLTHSPPDKLLLRLWNKYFLTEIYRNIQAFALKVLQECSSWAARNGPVEIFCYNTRNMFSETFVKSEKVFGCVAGAYYFHYQVEVWIIEVCKMSEIFWAKLYCKLSDLFC